MRFLRVIAAVALLLLIPMAASAADIRLYAGSTALSQLPNPYFAGAKMMVPVRVVEHLGGKVEAEAAFVRFQASGHDVIVTAGQSLATVDGMPAQLEVAPEIVDSSLFIPLRLLSEVIRICNIEWEQTTGIVRLLTNNVSTAETGVFNQPQPKPSEETAATLVAPAAKVAAAPAPPTPVSTPIAASQQAVSQQAAAATAKVQTVATTSTVNIVKPAYQPTYPQTLGAWEWHGANDTMLRAKAYGDYGSFILYLPDVAASDVQASFSAVPPKIILDINGFSVGADVSTKAFNDSMVQKVRLAAYKGKARLVMDLSQAVGYAVETVEQGIIVRVNRALSSLSFQDAPAGGLLKLDIPAQTPYSVTRLQGPDRVVIDLKQTTLVGGAKNIPVDQGPLSNVRASQYTPTVTRIVLDVDSSYKGEPFQLAGDKLSFQLHADVQQVGVAHLDENVDAVFVQGKGAFHGRIVQQYPDRLVLDIYDAQSTMPFGPQTVENSQIRRVEAIQYADNRFQVVIDISSKAEYRLITLPEGQGLAVVLAPKGIQGAHIAIDAGHGGEDPGAIGRVIGLKEKNINLDIAQRLGDMLTAVGAQVTYTRSDDTFIELSQRRALLTASKADVIVSIHANSVSSSSTQASGTETWYWNEADKSRTLAETVQTELVKMLGTTNRGVKREIFAVLRDEPAPAVLVEVAFVSNTSDERSLADASFRQKAAQGILNGIVAFLQPQGTDKNVVYNPDTVWRQLIACTDTTLLPEIANIDYSDLYASNAPESMESIE